MTAVHVDGVALRPSRLRAFDVIRTGSLGLRTRRLRTGLSTIGVAIGIAAMVAVLGLSASSQEQLRAQIANSVPTCCRFKPGKGSAAAAANCQTQPWQW